MANKKIVEIAISKEDIKNMIKESLFEIFFHAKHIGKDFNISDKELYEIISEGLKDVI